MRKRTTRQMLVLNYLIHNLKMTLFCLESLGNDQASDKDRCNPYDHHLIIYRNQYTQYQENLYDQSCGINCLNAFSLENMVNIILSEY